MRQQESTLAIKEKKKNAKQRLSLMRCVHKTDGCGKESNKIAMQLRQHLRPMEQEGLMFYAAGYWFLTDLGRDTLTLREGEDKWEKNQYRLR